MKRPERLHFITFLSVAVATWTAVLLTQGVGVGLEHLAPFGIVVGVLTGAYLAFDRWLWRMSYLQPWFVARPDLRGTWRVTLQPAQRSSESRQVTTPITCFMGIEQSLSTLKMHLMTSESESWLVADSIKPSAARSSFDIVGVYLNHPGIHLRGNRSEIHYGALALRTHGTGVRPSSMTGEYWTNRGTGGRLELADRIDDIHTRYEDASAAFSGSQDSS